MGKTTLRGLMILAIFGLLSISLVKADDPYRYYTWTVTYGTIAPLGDLQQVILINGKFPGPTINCNTNDNIILNLINKLDEPFLLTWNGIQQRKNSWQDGVLGTNCPIPPHSNYTYKFQAKDQIGSFTYFPSTAMHKAVGGFGAFNIYARSVIPVPYSPPAGDYTLLVGDWRTSSAKVIKNLLDSGKPLPSPKTLLINGQTHSTFSGDHGNTYLFRVSNVGLSTAFNFRIQGHKLKLVEIEGSNVDQNVYDSLDVHVGQSYAVLVTLDQPAKDYYIVASARFTKTEYIATATLHYSSSLKPVTGPVPAPPSGQFHWSMQQARSFKWNLTDNAARPNPQGSYHYGSIKISNTIVLANSAPEIYGKQHYAVNRVSFVQGSTPVKLADYFHINNVFSLNSIQPFPSSGPSYMATSVLPTSLHAFNEFIFQNDEEDLESWHLDGYAFWPVGFGEGKWTPESRKTYNLKDAISRHTVPVFPKSWTAILVSMDNQGMWNLRSAMWNKQYLGQQLYVRVYNPIKSLANEYNPPPNMLLCGEAIGKHV